MKWGVRRFQNPDGSYTAAGRARYNLGSASKGYQGTKKKSGGHKGTGSSLRAAKSISEDATKLTSQTAKMLRRSSEKSKARKRQPMDLSRMSDQELRDRVNRGNLERQYAQLYGSPQVTTGRDHIADALDNLGTGIAVAGSAASLALTIYGLKKMAGV